MDKTRRAEITVGLFVPTALSGLLIPASRVTNLTNVGPGNRNRGRGLATKFQDIDGILQLIRSNNGRRVETCLGPGSTPWRTGMKAKPNRTEEYTASPSCKIHKWALHDLQIELLKGAGI